MARRPKTKVIAVAAMMVLSAWSGAAPVEAATRCFVKTASGTGPTADVAKFQVYEGLLRSADSGLWSRWMTSGTTDGFKVGKPVYTCLKGIGLGVSCTGRARICRT